MLISSLKYRNNRTSARSNRTTQIDHDVFEGLPIRHWRKRPISINTQPERETARTHRVLSTGYAELPKPRDFDMLPEGSRLLLQAARMGLRKEAPVIEDEKEQVDEDEAGIEEDAGFVARKWALIPRELEGPEPEYLAKRRKGLPSVYNGITAPVDGPTQMRKTKMRKTNEEGQKIILEVLVPEGQSVDGEVGDEEITPIQAPAPGTMVEGIGVVNADGLVIVSDEMAATTNRKRPPVPRKKIKGPGRGRKKKVAFMPGTEGTASNDGSTPETSTLASDNIPTDSTHRALNGGLEMDEDTVMQDIVRDGEDSGEEGSEGEDEGDKGEREEMESLSTPDHDGSTSPQKPKEPTVSNLSSEMEKGDLEPSMLTETAQDPMLQCQSDAAARLESEGNVEIDSMLLDEKTTLHEPEASNGSLDSSVSEATPISRPIVHDPLEATPTTQADILTAITDTAVAPANEVSFEPMKSPAPAEKKADHTMRTDVVSDTALAALPMPESAINHEGTAPQAEQVVPSSLKTPSTGVNTEATTPMTFEEDVAANVSKIDLPQVQHSSPQQRPGLSQEIGIATPVQEHVKEPTKVPSPIEGSSQIASIQRTPSHVTDQLHSITQPAQTTGLVAELQVPTPRPLSTSQALGADHQPNISTPKAPTPSPPTPIDVSFDLQPPMLSPKAPTMSPPTPISRDISSSPDDPLLGQVSQAQQPPFRLDQEGEALNASNLKEQIIPLSQRIHYHGAPLVESQIDAEIPHAHDPLDGLAAPRQPSDQTSVDRLNENETVRFDDGEVDLLGTLERNLNQRVTKP